VRAVAGGWTHGQVFRMKNEGVGVGGGGGEKGERGGRGGRGGVGWNAGWKLFLEIGGVHARSKMM
jgi:hypothetical protein